MQLAWCRLARVFAEHLYDQYHDELFEPGREKTNVLVSDLVGHKPGCTATEDG